LARADERRLVAQEQSIVSGVAGRYATALFELARETDSVDAVGAQLGQFEQLIATMPDMARLVRSPVIPGREKAKALDLVLKSAGIDGIAANFLKLIAAQQRLYGVRDIIRAYRALADQSKNIKHAQVTLAQTPSGRILDDIKQSLKELAGDKVAVDVKIDPAIIGGIIVKLGSRMVDASLRTRLNGIRIAMKEVG
jgi:F-type H+-transporting ATPase subunit delta